MLTIEHLTKQFGEKTLFRDLCLTVDGPAVLWAPSGWGKTTLLRILMGLERPTTGSVEGVGRVAAVFQEDRLCPQLNAVQNVTLVLPGVENQYEEQITSDFQQLGMDIAALQLPARRLSGGQKRRVALLRALWAPSDTLLLDEPLGALDAFTRMSMQDEILNIWVERRQLALMVTHSIDEAVYMGTRVLVMEANPGRIIADIKIDEEFPRDRSSASFVEYRNEILNKLHYGGKNA